MPAAEAERRERIARFEASAEAATDPVQKEKFTRGIEWLEKQTAGIDIVIRREEIVISLPIHVRTLSSTTAKLSAFPLVEGEVDAALRGDDTLVIPALRAWLGVAELTRVDEL